MKKSLIVYISIILVVSTALIGTVWIFGEQIFVKEDAGVWVVKSEENYKNMNYADKIKNGVLNISDCGALPNSNYDYGDLFRSAIKTCIENNSTLALEKGTYYCSPESEEDGFLFDLSDVFADGFTLNGNGASIINTDNFTGLFRFAESSNITITDLNYDYFSVPWVQGEVVAIDEDTQQMTVLMDDDYTILDDSRYTKYFETIFGVVRDSKKPKLIDDEALFFFRIKGVKKSTDRGYVIQMGDESRILGQTLDVGDKITLNNRVNSGASVFDVRTCGNITIKNVNCYATNGCLVLGQYMTGDVLLDNVNILYKPDSNRWITGNSDGVHIQSGKGKVSLNNCTFEGLTDDSVNLYQAAAIVTQRVAGNKYLVSGVDWGTRVAQNVGDTVIFYDDTTGKALGEATVTALENFEGANRLYTRYITLDREIEGIVAGDSRENSTHVYIKNNLFDNSNITNCTFRNIRGRGLVLRVTNTKIEGNNFENISHHGIFIGNWVFEGPYSEKVQILSNKINNVGYNRVEANSYRAGAIGIYTENYSEVDQGTSLAHKEIIIENNIITDYHARAIRLGNVSGATIKGNTFKIERHNKSYNNNQAVFVNYSQDISILNNKFLDNRKCIEADIMYTESNVTNMNIGDNEYALPKEKNIVLK